MVVKLVINKVKMINMVNFRKLKYQYRYFFKLKDQNESEVNILDKKKILN